MDHTFLSALILLLLVLDPLGSLAIFIPIMRTVPPERRRWVAVREVSIAFGVLFAFMFFGEAFLRVMRLSERSLEVAGGVILLMVAIRMIFSHDGGVYGMPEGKEPMIFPLAVPLLAGPSAMATVLLLASRQPDRLMSWVGALSCAMAVSGIVLLLCDRIRRLLGDSVVSAIEKLMGLVLTAIAVEMILAGLKRYFMSPL
ncbi:MarC family protein [soil metagenome]